jgi:hypothetical protein
MNLTTVFQLFVADVEVTVQDIITMPGIIWFFGVLVWFFAAAGRRQGKVQRWKWILAYLLLLASVYAAWAGLGSDPDKHMGFGPYVMNDFGVRSLYDGKKMILSLILSFFLPILTIGILLFVDKQEKRRMRDLVS